MVAEGHVEGRRGVGDPERQGGEITALDGADEEDATPVAFMPLPATTRSVTSCQSGGLPAAVTAVPQVG